MRVGWLTDIHLNFLPPPAEAQFLSWLAAENLDTVLCGGDVSEGPEVPGHLRALAEAVDRPVYFVLGNHDYYFSSIAAVRDTVGATCRGDPRLVYLSETDVVELTPGVALVGHDGWADAYLGDYERSLVSMNDHRLIGEFIGLDKASRLGVLRKLGAEAAAHIARVLPLAAERYGQVILLTHVPPFEGACWYQGRISDAHWLPHFTCFAVGEAILEVMSRYPQTMLTVLCGHTHSPGRTQIRENVLALTGGAEYGQPALQRVFELE